jgi:small ligand-binding sensory domain FIST
LGDDVPDDYGGLSPNIWKGSVGLKGYEEQQGGNSAFFLLPSPGFNNKLDDFMRGLNTFFPQSTTFGAVASTVSSLSRARLFLYDSSDPDCIQTLADGCVGVGLSGDIQVKTMIAQGAKPVGGIYQIVKGQERTIQAIALDEVATELVQGLEEEEDEDDSDDARDTKATLQAAYAKARIPKPPLAEANFVMKTLSDDDQTFMKKALLVGLERGGSLGRTPSELERLAEGRGHRFRVHKVASAGMKDGSVTMQSGSVDIVRGTRFRFFVRESDFAKKEVEALWIGYKRRVLTENMESGGAAFAPTGCFLFPTLDRGNKFFLGKPGFESSSASTYLPTVPCFSGFFCNGVIGEMDGGGTQEPASVHGSASGYVLFGSSKYKSFVKPTGILSYRYIERVNPCIHF